jgi:hypothetical protein
LPSKRSERGSFEEGERDRDRDRERGQGIRHQHMTYVIEKIGFLIGKTCVRSQTAKYVSNFSVRGKDTASKELFDDQATLTNEFGGISRSETGAGKRSTSEGTDAKFQILIVPLIFTMAQ